MLRVNKKLEILRKVIDQAPHTTTLAIVGCGPRGLYCLERLAYELSKIESDTNFEITIFEPSQWPGAGPVYDLRQPEYLRINYTNSNIDTWCLRTSRRGKSFVEWMFNKYPKYMRDESYAPRAIAGEYLHDCFLRVIGELRRTTSVRILKNRVMHLSRGESGYNIRTNRSEFIFDQVAITTGHEGWRPATGCKSESFTGGKVIDRVFPVDKMLSTRSISPGANVAIRGFSLSFIDAALALTEGRGGAFRETNTRLKYRRSGFEPSKIYPFCRSGRPMLCKPEQQMIRVPSAVENLWSEGRERIRLLPDGMGSVSFETDIWTVVLETADHALSLCGPKALGEARLWFREWIEFGGVGGDVLREMKRACCVASGERPVDVAWALAESWRQLFSVISEKIGRGGLSAADWKSYNEVKREMERIVFGPPLLNFRKIVALIEDGVVDLSVLRSPKVEPLGGGYLLSTEKGSTLVDNLVSSVIPGPQDFAPGSLLKFMLNDGLARRANGSGGIEVGFAGELIGEDSLPNPDLSLFGRATEGWILGNDSLSRSHGDEISCWARVAAQRGGEMALSAARKAVS